MEEQQRREIETQKFQVFEQSHWVNLTEPCAIGNGILQPSPEEMNAYVNAFDASDFNAAFFIPASGSGSRMFSFLIDFLTNGNNTESSDRFFSEMEKFAFYQNLPLEIRNHLAKLTPDGIAMYLLNEEGMNFKGKPKGLIPFHTVENGTLNPFQEHILQAKQLFTEKVALHFTVQENVSDDVERSIRELGKEQLRTVEVSYSTQDKTSDAFAFHVNGELVETEKGPLRRPSGHGALIENLNAVDADILLIKNVDNVQHLSKCEESIAYWKGLLGILNEFKSDLIRLENHFSVEALEALNGKYQWLSSEQIQGIDIRELKRLNRRPIRVCGMVLNEGAPGGGPFWIKDNQGVSKQIVEGVQIDKGKPDQKDIVERSSHFNPVFIVASKVNIDGERLDLRQFIDREKYLVVNKTFEGTPIRFRELPGLWNGGMHHWNTIFVEVPSSVFTPAKTALDLLSKAHQDSNGLV